MKTWMSALSAVLLSMVLFAGIASAHVNVYPKESVQGTYEVFTVRVPSEKESPTVKVELKFSVEEVAVSRVEAKPGWTYQLTKDAADKITGIVWTASGEGLLATEFGEFKLQGKVADSAKQITWKAYQAYKDGSVVEWTGASDSKTPASVTAVKAKDAGAATDSHGHTASASAPAAATPAPAAASTEAAAAPAASSAPLYFSVAGMLLGAVALMVSLRKKSR
ncbi:YcnI family copper-binding membrane protein [Paenibacillus sp. y28]|uniref:YcnI family copper-binding membrane protein n=1 Tax=Paenibacillus sp. y28 TaxID=3129110 RepID=UPI003016F0DF